MKPRTPRRHNPKPEASNADTDSQRKPNETNDYDIIFRIENEDKIKVPKGNPSIQYRYAEHNPCLI